MKNTEIGMVTMQYDRHGNVINASFKPTMELPFDLSLKSQLLKIETSNDEQKIKENAQTVFSSWFAKMNEIELRDFEITDIVTDIERCMKYENGNVQECIIKFTYVTQ